MTNGILLTQHDQEITQCSPDAERVGSGHETISIRKAVSQLTWCTIHYCIYKFTNIIKCLWKVNWHSIHLFIIRSSSNYPGRMQLTNHELRVLCRRREKREIWNLRTRGFRTYRTLKQSRNKHRFMGNMYWQGTFTAPSVGTFIAHTR